MVRDLIPIARVWLRLAGGAASHSARLDQSPSPPLTSSAFTRTTTAGLGLYWLVNNVVTTATTVLIRNSVKTPEMATATTAQALDPPKAQGFGRRYGEIVESTDSATGTTVRP